MTKKIAFIIISFILAVAVISASILGVYLLTPTDGSEVICSGVIQLNTVYEDYGYIAEMAVKLLSDNYSGASCSAAVKTLDNGDTIVGRNLDMLLSNQPVYIGKTDISGLYKTIYATYIPEFGVDFDYCSEKGAPRYMEVLAPFIAYDSFNEKGLYIQINMRMDQQDENGDYVFACEHTNEYAEKRISALELPAYITLRCKNVKEAVELIKSIDIYTLGGELNWPFSYIIADAEGNYGLLELGSNEAKWIPGQDIQTNFYISEDLNSVQLYKQGLGRYDYIESEIDSIEDKSDMLRILENVKYSEIYNPDNAAFDIRSEIAGETKEFTNEYLDNEQNWNLFKEQYKDETELFNSLSDQEKRDAGKYWSTIYTAIVNCSQKTIEFRFFEKYDFICSVGFESRTADHEIDYIMVTVALEIFSILLCLVLLYGNLFESRRNTEKITQKQRIFSTIVVTTIIGTAFDIISWIFEGDMQYLGLVKWATLFSIIITYVLIGQFSIYLYIVLKDRQDIKRTSFKLYAFGCIIAIAVTTIIYLLGGLYTVIDGNYYEGPIYSFYTAVTAIFIIALLIIVTAYKKVLGRHDFIVIYLYVLIPVLSALVGTVMPEVSFGYPASGFALVMVYVMLHSETTNKLSDEKNISVYMANHDVLTGLNSRRAYVEQLEMIANAGKENVGVLFADINGLKYTNDRFGHAAGDKLLIKFAEMAKNHFREKEIYRISGDEFVILLPDISKDLLDKRIDSFMNKINSEDIPIACIGVEYGSCKKVNELVSIAENHMYENKRSFYTEHPEMKR